MATKIERVCVEAASGKLGQYTDRTDPTDLYASLHTGTEGDEDFYRAVCAGADRVLELGCGSGRILAALADEVATLHGVDSSDEALAQARANLPASVGLHRAEMESFDVGCDFDRVLIPFNGIYCLPDLDSVQHTFVQVEKALGPEGLLVFDGYAGDPIHDDESFEEGFDEEDEIATVDVRGKGGSERRIRPRLALQHEDPTEVGSEEYPPAGHRTHPASLRLAQPRR